jgi:iron complex transport system substrate-binding protein
MRKWMLFFALLIIALPAWAQEEGWPRTVVDANGTEVNIPAPAERIVSLSLAADETLLPALGVERFAAITEFAKDPGLSSVAVLAQAVEETVISAEDTERIISLAPDLVIAASFTSPESVAQLRDAGLTVFVTGYATSFETVRSNARMLGEATGAEAEVEAMLAEMDAEIAAVGEAIGDLELAQRVLFITPGNYSSGVESTIRDIITAAGAVDVAAQAGVNQAAPVSDEFIIEQNPDVILLTGWTPYDPTFVDTFLNNPAFMGLDAVLNGRVYQTFDAHLTTVSPFISEGVKDVAALVYPNRYTPYPLTITDAAGIEHTFSEAPDSILYPGTSVYEWLGLIEAHLPDDTAFRLVEAGGEVAFANAPMEGVDAEFVRLYHGDTPAEVVANLFLMGDVLDARTAALAAVAEYTDALESATS